MPEILLQPNSQRYVIFPIKHQDIWDFYQKGVASFWTPEEIDMKQDLVDWKTKVNDNEKHFLSHVLAFFAASDGIVNDNLVTRFCQEVQLPELRAFYTMQMMIETIHGHTYSLLIDTLIHDPQEKTKLFKAVETIPSIKKKAEWAIRWIEDEKASFAQRLLCFAVVEGIFFSGSFASIFWFKKKGLLPGLTFSNELISRDEGLHVQVATYLYRNYIEESRLSSKAAYDIIREAVMIETEFFTEALPVSLLGMNSEMMTEYIKFVADRLLLDMGYKKLYNVKNPFDFMENISMEGKKNFFESRVPDYKRLGVNTGDTVNLGFNVSEDF